MPAFGRFRLRGVARTALRRAAGAAALSALLVIGCSRKDEGAGSVLERSGTIAGRPVRLRSELRPARVTLGDPAVWRLRAELPAGRGAGDVRRGESGPALDVAPLEPPRVDRGPGRAVWTASFRVRGFDLGRAPLPPFQLVVRGAETPDTLEFPRDTLLVDSITPAATGSLEPDRGPIPTELRPLDRAVAVGGALLLAAIALAVVLALRARRKRTAPAPAAAEEQPDAAFRRALEELRGELPSIPRDRFYEKLSFAARRYVDAVTGVQALDLTTSELLRSLEGRAELEPPAVGALARTLRRSDLAKFARKEDPLDEARAALDEALDLAGRLVRPAPKPPPAETPPAQTPAQPPPAGPAGGREG